MPTEWFYNWFNSPFYHLLYSKHNDAEAEYFINNLCEYLRPKQNTQFLDIACGRGRHAVYLNKKGYPGVGIDLSIENIRYAKQFENNSLHFFVHDMRRLFYSNYFDIAFNLFTSFGYFKTDEEHISSLINFNSALKPGGLFILDYFNSNKIVKTFIADDTKTADGIDFHLQKTLRYGKIIKNIAFESGNKSYNFKEIVRTFTRDDFQRFFEQSRFEIISNFGSYSLDKFDINNSDRLIFLCKKSDA
jgi:SAM-dependent methyltransferase